MELNKFISHLAETYFQIKGVYRYKIPSGSKGVEKASPYPGFIFPLAGSSEYHFEGTPYLVTRGTVLHGSGGGIIQKRVASEEEWEFIVVLYEPLQEPGDFALVNTHFSLSIQESPQLLDLLSQMHQVSNLPGGFSAFQTETLARRVFEETFYCARNYKSQESDGLFQTTTDYIHDHYMEPLSVKQLAALHHVNENHLFYIFQKYAGMGAGEYLLNYRLNRARALLVTSDTPIREIAAQVGYPDPLHFSRMFKKYFGVPPSKLRK